MQYPIWVKDLNPDNSSVTPSVDSPVSITVCNESKHRGRGIVKATITNSGSSMDQTDEDEAEADGNWQCDDSVGDLANLRRIKRKVSNRDSARRSRQRKQAHLVELEQKVEETRIEFSYLFKQLIYANQQYKDATTNNRVLKSDVEALRAKVELAEDMVTRGSMMSSNWNYLLKNHLNFSNEDMFYVPYPEDVSNVNNNRHRGHEDSPQTMGLDTKENFQGYLNNNNNNSMMSSGVSSISENWSWENHAPTSSD